MTSHCISAFQRKGLFTLLALAVGGLMLITGCADQVYKVHIWLGKKFSEERYQDLPAAEREFRAAVRLKPASSEAHSKLGFALSQLGKKEEAIAEYSEAVRLNPADARGHYILGSLLKLQGMTDEAIAELCKAVLLKPDDDEVLIYLATYLDSLERRQQARVYWEKSLEVVTRPETVVRIKNRLAEPD